MAETTVKTILMTPDLTLPDFIRSRIMQHRIELLSCDTVEELLQFSRQMKPQIAVIYVDDEASAYQEILEAIRTLYSQRRLSFILLASNGLPLEQLHADAAGFNALIHRYSDDFQAILHNILFLCSELERQKEDKALQRIKDTFIHCMQVLYRERDVDKIFQRLINYFPKVILFDHWAIFSLDRNLAHLEHFAQFVPPMRSRKEVHAMQLVKMIEGWLRSGSAFMLTPREDEELFMTMAQLGWPIQLLYFFPMEKKGKAVGGILVGHTQEEQLNSAEIRFVTEMNTLISRRILEESLDTRDHEELVEFSERLISDRFDQEAILKSACRKLREVTGAASTIFWQFNKGFGFLFPRYFCQQGEAEVPEAAEKNVIYAEKERFLSRIIDRGKIQTFTELYEDRRFEESTLKVFRQYGYHEIVILPLRIRGEVIGAMIVNNEEGQKPFNLVAIHQSEEIMERTQLALEDAQRTRDAELKLKQLARIFELGHQITHDLKLKEILSRIAQNLRKSLAWNDIAILIHDEVAGQMRVMTRLGFAGQGGGAWRLDGDMELAEFKAILKKCERIGHSQFYRHQRKSDAKSRKKSETKAEWHESDLLLIPLTIRKKNLGYLVVHDPVDRLRPTEEKTVPLEYYASQAAVAVENSQLYDQLRASEERYRALAQTMSLGLVTCDPEKGIVYANPAFQQLLNIPEPDLIGKPLEGFFAGGSREAIRGVFCDLLADTDAVEQVENIEFEVIGRDDISIPVSVYGFPLLQNQQKAGFFLILTDLRMIKRLEQMKADFNSMIVHDLRSPMNVIQGFIELIRNQVVGDINTEQEELLDIAKENVKKVLSLVDNFLVAAKLDVGKFAIEPKLDEINGLIERQIENHRVLVKNKNIKLDIDLDTNLPLLYFDSLRIEQVLNNLLSNAMKFTPEDGEISVNSILMKLNENGSERYCACISVRDTGAGIPEEQLDQVFEKYEQSESNQNLNVRGTGLGLSICKEIVTLHGGDIWVESKPNAGSTFSFTLPIRSEFEKLV